MALIAKHGKLREIERDLLTELMDRIEISEPVMVNGATKQDIRVVYRMVGAMP